MKIYCCSCDGEVSARLTGGEEIYPHRQDLYHKKFWKCDTCQNYVGCHPRSGNKPLGCIPSPDIKNARQHIHRILDPLWQRADNPKKMRGRIYSKIKEQLGGKEYHTAEIRTLEEARNVYRIVANIRDGKL